MQVCDTSFNRGMIHRAADAAFELTELLPINVVKEVTCVDDDWAHGDENFMIANERSAGDEGVWVEANTF